MAIDVTNLKAGVSGINNGSMTFYTKIPQVTGHYHFADEKHLPDVQSLQSKYTDRFDDWGEIVHTQ